jgi:hypothetical protein
MSRWPRGTLYPQKLAITSPTIGGRSVGIVRSRTRTMEVTIITLKLLTFLGHWLPQLCWLCFFSSLGDIHSLQRTYSWLRPQWHCTRSIWLHGSQSPGWQGFRQLCIQPSGRGLVQPDSHCSQLLPAYKITHKKDFRWNVHVGTHFMNCRGLQESMKRRRPGRQCPGWDSHLVPLK